jgi:anaerobic magnesium-protoporphyrin IX monomethyl ester cyclase
MKVLFVNPPVIRSEHSSAKNNFRIDGFVFKSRFRKIPGANRLFHALHKLGLGNGVRYGVRAGSRWPWTMDMPTMGSPNYPFFMGYAAALVKLDGHDVNIIDSVANEVYDYEEFLQQVRKEVPDLIIFECSTPTIDIDLWLTNKLVEIADVAVCGPHFSNDEIAQDTLREHPHIKYILKGEYILGAQRLVKTLVPGIYDVNVVEDLESIPFPFRDYPSAVNYFDPSMPTPMPQLQIYGSKGCPFKCTFCAWPQAMFMKKVALRKPEHIAEEIRQALKLNKYKSIFFDDDTFNMGTERISKLCDHLKEIGLPWTMMGRLDISPDWLYDKMIESGCVGMRFGIETFNLQVLINVKKGIERKDFKGTLERLSNKYPNLMLHITMMKDMPGQTEEIHQLDMKIVHEMGFLAQDKSPKEMLRTFQLSHCAPFPGTEMYDQIQSSGDGKTIAILKDYRKHDGGQHTVMKDLA